MTVLLLGFPIHRVLSRNPAYVNLPRHYISSNKVTTSKTPPPLWVLHARRVAVSCSAAFSGRGEARGLSLEYHIFFPFLSSNEFTMNHVHGFILVNLL